jgi:RNA polymerase sigma factor (TIGR02999 family)
VNDESPRRPTSAARGAAVSINRVPMPQSENAHTDLLDELRSGHREALDRITVLLYDELRQIAHRHRLARGRDGSLATTAIVHEAYLELVSQSRTEWNDRTHFLALAAVAMRHILADRAKARARAKRGGDRTPVTFDDAVIASDEQRGALPQIDAALDRLALVDRRLASVVEYRFFGGMTHGEIAAALGVTVRIVDRDWVKARMLLRDDLIA